MNNNGLELKIIIIRIAAIVAAGFLWLFAVILFGIGQPWAFLGGTIVGSIAVWAVDILDWWEAQ